MNPERTSAGNTTHVLLAGNPNCGKTTLFNALTGTRQRVGNWPGVTVEKKTGSLRHADEELTITDLPGIYSLHRDRQADSIDEEIALREIMSGTADVILNIVDASNLQRGLYLTLQLIDAGLPVVVALNMMDVAHGRGVHLDVFGLAKELNCPVLPMVASRKEGLQGLVDMLTSRQVQPKAGSRRFSRQFDHALEKLGNILQEVSGANPPPLILMELLLNPEKSAEFFPGQPEVIRYAREVRSTLPENLHQTVAEERYRAIDALLTGVQRQTQVRHSWTELIDTVVLNRFAALPIFLLIMYLMFMFSINIGGAFIDLFDQLAGAFVVDAPRYFLHALGLPGPAVALLADGLGGGIQLVATFIPIIGCLFLFLSLLEDSGYMMRAAFIIDRAMSRLGLPGRSFVPLIVGFGCNVPAIMATRSLHGRQDRLLTIIMAPYMSCGARLTVYALFAAAFFPVQGQNVVFGLYLIGILAAVVSGLVLRRFMLNSQLSPLIVELPTYHLPALRSILLHTWSRLNGFLWRAGKAIVAVVILLNLLGSLGTDGSIGNQNTENSVLASIGKQITPLFAPMGVREENWPAAVGIFTGIFAKEVVVGTLDALYTQMVRPVEPVTPEMPELLTATRDAFMTVPTNLSALTANLLDPLGISIDGAVNLQEAAQDQAVQIDTLDIMPQMFNGQAGAFSYLLFILLYLPCVATIGVIYKEAGPFWAMFSTAWSLVMAYAVSVVCYQALTLYDHPASSLLWILSMCVAAGFSYLSLILLGRRQAGAEGLIPVVNLH